MPEVLCRASVTVTQNMSLGATNWPGSPIVSTVVNPSSESTAKSFNGGPGGNTNFCQTFTVTATNFLLDRIAHLRQWRVDGATRAIWCRRFIEWEI